MIRPASTVRTVLVFLVVGPVAPFLVLIGALALVSGARTGVSDLELFIVGLLRGVVMSYMCGGLQAGLAGLTCAWLSPRLKKTGGWLWTCLLTGAAWGAATVVACLFMPDLPAMIAIIFGVFGAIGGICSGLVTRNRRPIRDTSPELAETFA